MAKLSLTKSSSQAATIAFHSIRNISSPEDLAEGRSVYAGQMPISAIVNLPSHENVRSYLVDAEGKQRRSPTQVHLAIRDTLRNRPDSFSVLNGGIVLVAKSSKVDEQRRQLQVEDVSIINGSQTQGEIRNYLNSGGNDDIHVKFELIVTDDEDLVAEVFGGRRAEREVGLSCDRHHHGAVPVIQGSERLQLTRGQALNPLHFFHRWLICTSGQETSHSKPSVARSSR